MTKQGTHLAILRSIARRAAAGSSLLKVWSVLNVGALLAVAANPLHRRFTWLAVFLTLLFWTVDAYFLRQQRLYRRAYEHVRGLREAEVDFSLDTRGVDGDDEAWSTAMFSPRLLVFYGAVLASIGVARWVLAAR